MNLLQHSDLSSLLTRLLSGQFLVLVSDLHSSIQTYRSNFIWCVFAESNRNNHSHLSLGQGALPKFTLRELEFWFVVDLLDTSPALLVILHSHWQLKYLASK